MEHIKLAYKKLPQERDRICDDLLLSKISTEEREKLNYLLEIEKHPNWKTESIKEMGENEKYKFSTMYDTETKLYYCKGVINIEILPEEAVLFFTRPEYAKKINPLCTDSEVVDKSEENVFSLSREIRISLKGFWPVRPRELVLHTFSAIEADRSLAVNVSYSDEKVEESLSVKDGFVRAKIHIAGFVVRRIEADEGHNAMAEVVYIVKADPKGWIPKLALKTLSSSQANLVLGLRSLYLEEKEKFKNGGDCDALIGEIFKMRESLENGVSSE